MRLRTLVQGCLAATSAGLIVVGALSLHAWMRIGAGLEQVEKMASLRGQLVQLGATVDYVTLLRSDEQGFRSLAREAHQLAESLQGVDEPEAGLGARHLEEISSLSALMLEGIAPGPSSPANSGLMDRPAAQQMRIHLHEISAVLEELTTQAQRRVFAEQQRIAALGLFSALVFAGLAFVGFLTMHRRVARPVFQIQKGLRRVAEGDLEVSIPVLAEDELGELATTFNDMVTRRKEQQSALEESEARLRQSQRLESVGQLTGGVAHDFNNLLTVVQGNAELLVEELGHEPRRQALAGMILKAAERGADLTRSLLAFARRQPLEPRAFDLNARVADMQPLLHRTLGEDVEMRMVPGAGLPRVMADPVQLESAILNLCLNARDAMLHGGLLTLETGLRELDAAQMGDFPDSVSGSFVTLAVSDTGCGIPADQQERVLEPFYTTKEVGMGTGLGLPMVYGFCKQSGGHFSLYSEPGEGTTVRLYLPAAEKEDVTAATAVESDSREVLGGSECILVVEDDPMVREYATQQLSQVGYRVLSADSGPAALDRLEQGETVDLLFTDIVMPGGMNGRQLADLVQERHSRIAVLFTTGYTENAVVHHGRLDPGVELLGKPYRRQELLRRVRQVLDGHRQP